jgi:Domain of unknown function (DUF397)
MIHFRPTFRQADFRKSSFREPQLSCVEVAQQAGWVEIRDSKTTFGGIGDGRLVFAAAQFTSLLAHMLPARG